jgi:hypothetical protein
VNNPCHTARHLATAAAHAATTYGLTSPGTTTLVETAARAADTAYDAGHPVHHIHPPRHGRPQP